MCMYILPFSVCQERREWSSSNPYAIPEPVLSLPNSYGHRRTCMVVVEPISSSSNLYGCRRIRMPSSNPYCRCRTHIVVVEPVPLLSNPIIKPVSLTPNPYCRCHFLYRVQRSFLGCMCCQWAVPVVGWYLLSMRGISGVGNGQVATEGSHCRSGCMGIGLWASLVGFDRSWCGSMCWWFGFAAPRHRRAFHGVIELGVGGLSL